MGRQTLADKAAGVVWTPSKSKSPHPLSPDQAASDFQSAAAMKSRKFKTRMWNPERMDISNQIAEALIFCWCGRVMNKCPPSVLGFRGALSCTEAEVHSCTTSLLASLCSGPSVTGKICLNSLILVVFLQSTNINDIAHQPTNNEKPRNIQN